MTRMMTAIMAIVAAGVLTGCVAPPVQAPPPPSAPVVVSSVDDWRLMALEVVRSLDALLADQPNKAPLPIAVEARDARSPFATTMRDMLLSELAAHGYRISLERSGLRMVIDTQVIRHARSVPGMPPAQAAGGRPTATEVVLSVTTLEGGTVLDRHSVQRYTPDDEEALYTGDTAAATAPAGQRIEDTGADNVVFLTRSIIGPSMDDADTAVGDYCSMRGKVAELMARYKIPNTDFNTLLYRCKTVSPARH